MKKKVIGEIVLDSIDNIGEEYLVDITKCLIEKNGATAYQISLDPSTKRVGLFRTVIFSFLFALSSFFKETIKYKILNLAYKVRLTKYFREELKLIDGIIYTIGMLKFSTQNFSYSFHLINTIALAYGIPVLFSSMSVELPPPPSIKRLTGDTIN